MIVRHHIRSSIVSGWRKRNHSVNELAAIKAFLKTGDPTALPLEYRRRLGGHEGAKR